MRVTSAIQIDQVLHGYDRGHKELAASISLDDQSRALMLVLSDLLASTGLEEGDSYLTSYPLRHASKHVLARTWAAGRGYRPGSVWTHSLILDYQALTLIPDLAALRSLFRYPEQANRNDYAVPVVFSSTERSDVLVEQGSRTIDALMQIYSKNPGREINLPRSKSEFDEILALALWRQMWPGLRRDFAFITCASDGLSSFDAGCVLRFFDHEYGHSGPIAETLDEGYRWLLEDLPKPGPTALRTFLGRYVIESKQPRQLVIPLAQLQYEKKRASINLRLNHIRSLSQGEPLPRLVRDILVEELESAPSNRDVIDIVHTFRHEVIKIDLIEVKNRIGSFSENEFRHLLATTIPCDENSLGWDVFVELVHTSPLEKLVAVANKENRLPILQLRPELAYIGAYWPMGDESRAELISQIGSLIVFDLDKAVEVFGYSMGRQTVTALLHTSTDVSPAVVMLMCNGSQEVCDIVANWIVQMPQRLAGITGMQEMIRFDTVEALARAQINLGTPIQDASFWLKLVSSAGTEANPPLGNACLVVGYISALTLDGKASLILARSVYDSLQQAVQSYRLSRTEERYLESHLPSSSRTFSLRTSLSRSAVLKWPPLETLDLGALTVSRNPEYLKELVCETESIYGRRKLEEALNSADFPADMKNRIRLILTLINSKKIRSFWWW